MIENALFAFSGTHCHSSLFGNWGPIFTVVDLHGSVANLPKTAAYKHFPLSIDTILNAKVAGTCTIPCPRSIHSPQGYVHSYRSEMIHSNCHLLSTTADLPHYLLARVWCLFFARLRNYETTLARLNHGHQIFHPRIAQTIATSYQRMSGCATLTIITLSNIFARNSFCAQRRFTKLECNSCALDHDRYLLTFSPHISVVELA